MIPDHLKMLVEMAEMASGVRFGLPAYEARLEELAGGVPSRGDGGGGASGTSPTEAAAIARSEGRQPDPQPRLASDFRRKLERAHAAVRDLFDVYASVAAPRPGVEKLTDPGCELCAQVPGHWCPVYGVVEIDEPAKTKRDGPRKRVLRLCQWCYHFRFPSRAGRLPVYDEVLAHSEGRPVRWSSTPPIVAQR